MSHLISSELLKLRTTRTFWWVSLLAIGLSCLLVFAQLAGSDAISNESDLRSLFANVGATGFLLLVLGVVGAGGEYRHRTITSTFLVAPDRRRVIVAKALAHGLAGLAVAAVSLVLCLAITIPWLSGDGESLGSLGLAAGPLAGLLAAEAAYIAIAAMLGVGVGALITNQVAAVVGVVLVLFVVDPVLAGVVHGYGRFSISGLAIGVSGSGGRDVSYSVFGQLPALLVYLAYAGAAVGIAAAIAPRRDVS